MAAATYDSVSSGEVATGSTNFSITSPASAEAGDGLIIAILADSAVTIGAPAGVSLLATDVDNGKKLSLYKANNVGPSDSIGSFTRSASTNIAWAIVAITNADGSTTGDILGNSDSTSYATTSSVPLGPLSTTRNQQMVVAVIFVTNNQRTANSWPFSLTERVEQNVGASAGIRVATRQGIATGTSLSGNVTLSGNDTGGGLLISILPAVMEGAASMAGQASMTAAGVKVKGGAATLSGVASMTVAGQKIIQGFANLAGVASLTAAGVRSAVAAATMSAVATMTAGGSRVHLAASSMAGQADLTADGIRDMIGAASMAGTASFTASGVKVFVGQVSMAAVAELTAAGLLIRNGAATLSGVATLTAAGARILEGFATLEAEATLTAAAVRLRFSVGITADLQEEDRYTVTVNLTQDHIAAITRLLGPTVRIKAQVSGSNPRYKARVLNPDTNYRVRIEE